MTGSADLLLHPVRLRILQAFLGDRALTTAQLSTELSDVPAASLYRHVARLVRGGALQVVAERRVRGAVERTYVLRQVASRVRAGEIASMGADQLRAMFMAFIAGLLGDIDRYLGRGQPDVLRDGVTLGIEGLWLTDAELIELMRELYIVLDGRRANQPGQSRRRRLLASMLLPGDEESQGGET